MLIDPSAFSHLHSVISKKGFQVYVVKERKLREMHMVLPRTGLPQLLLPFGPVEPIETKMLTGSPMVP